MNYRIDIRLLDMPNPSPEEILEDGFSLPIFIEKQLKHSHKLIGDEVFEHFDREEKPKQEEIDIITNNYYTNVEKITFTYKEDLQLGKVKDDWYTKKLIEITKQYFEDIKKIKILKQKQELLEYEQNIELEKLEKKLKQKERINKFLKGEIEIIDLHFDDLKHIKIDKDIREKLEKVKRKIINVDFKEGKILEEKIDTMTIRELIKDYKTSKGKTR